MDWLALLAVQGTLKSLLQHHSSKVSSALSYFYHPALTFIHDYWRNHDFDYMDLCSKTTYLLFNTLSRFVIAFLPRSKHLLISWLQEPSTVIMKSKKIKSVTVCIVSPSICHEVMEPKCWVLSQLFHSPLSSSSRDSLVSLCFLPYIWCYLHIWGY